MPAGPAGGAPGASPARAPRQAPAAAPAPQTGRYFIGLRPAPAVRQRLHRLALTLAARHDGRAMEAARMHLTLVFLGQAPRALEPALLALLRTLPRPGALRLDRLGSFGPRLLWIGPSATPAWLEAMSGQARAGLDALGAGFDRKPLRPHVTLVRSARRPPAEDSSAPPRPDRPVIDFGPSELLLVESMPAQGRYRWIAP